MFDHSNGNAQWNASASCCIASGKSLIGVHTWSQRRINVAKQRESIIVAQQQSLQQQLFYSVVDVLHSRSIHSLTASPPHGRRRLYDSSAPEQNDVLYLPLGCSRVPNLERTYVIIAILYHNLLARLVWLGIGRANMYQSTENKGYNQLVLCFVSVKGNPPVWVEFSLVLFCMSVSHLSDCLKRKRNE